jgi:predicted TIM-barrel fold metal-dependent hydrolase
MLVQMLDLARDLVGLDRVLYGSEHTLCTPTELIDLLLGINRYAQAQKVPAFAAKDIEMMLGLNAARVYGIQPAKRT